MTYPTKKFDRAASHIVEQLFFSEHQATNLPSHPMTSDLSWKTQHALRTGALHLLYAELTNDGTENVAVPCPDDPSRTLWLIVRDCEGVARRHVKKQPNLQRMVMDSIISTTDVDHWKDQRGDFVEAFVPGTALQDALPVSVSRARVCAAELEALKGRTFDASDFYLREAQAQLQLGMFGFPPEFERETNENVRRAFGTEDRAFLESWARRALKLGGGPLAEALQDREPRTATEPYGNALIFAFAGHDTTGHTLTFLSHELSRRPEVQDRLCAEVDAFWRAHPDADAWTLALFKELPFMTRCIMETLRLWPAVANGTFRELVMPETIQTRSGDVDLPAGTWVQIPNWARHRSKTLWGADADEWNPDRAFRPEEIWEDAGFAFTNPCSDRFSPFTYPPRDCIGKNFSQMEMRIVLLHVLARMRFERVTERSVEGINGFTMGPRDPHNSFRTGLPMRARSRL